MVKRLKTPATPVPQGRPEAEALAVRLADELRSIQAINAAAAAEIAQVKLKAKLDTEAPGKVAKSMFAALAAYAEANRAELLEAKRKSINFAAGTVGWRFSSPTVEISDDMEEAVIAYLEANGLERFLRETIEIDKPAILAEPKAVAKVPGLSIGRTESFFFAPLELDKEQTRVVATIAGAEEAA